MFYGNSVEQTRERFYSSWKKFQRNEPLEALEQQIAQVIKDHPEYHAIFNQDVSLSEQSIPQADRGESNPFLHLGLHLAIRDQITLDRPKGIRSFFQALCQRYKDELEAEHALMDCLAEILWLAQREGVMPSEDIYLSICRKLINRL